VARIPLGGDGLKRTLAGIFGRFSAMPLRDSTGVVQRTVPSWVTVKIVKINTSPPRTLKRNISNIDMLFLATVANVSPGTRTDEAGPGESAWRI
jgi:hypothetical protein